MTAFLKNGSEVLASMPDFKLVGRDEALQRLCAILMRSKSSSVIVFGPGGVGCSKLIYGLQDLKKNPDSPFDIVSKRLFWLDIDGLFSSNDSKEIDNNFKKIMTLLDRTHDSILIIDDARDFYEGARNSNTLHFFNQINAAIRDKRTQVIFETRDEDLEVVLKVHSDMRECYTLMDLEEPMGNVLQSIVEDSAKHLYTEHGIQVSQDAIEAAIELTNKYRTRDAGLSRAQPERSVTLLDRALASYRLDAHQKPPRLRELEIKLLNNHLSSAEKDDMEKELNRLSADWAEKNVKIRGLYQKQRDGEKSILALEEQLEAQKAEDAKHKVDPSSTEAKTTLGSFNSMVQNGQLLSEAAIELQNKIAVRQELLDKDLKEYRVLIDEVNKSLKLTKEIVTKEFAAISGISANKLNENEREKLKGLRDGLATRIFGQDRVLDQVTNGIRVHVLGKRNKDRPLPYLFLGPSGVGKTEISKVIALLTKDDENALMRFDMSEYMEKHAVAKLIGAPPGYEGFEAGGILTNAARKNPNRVYLFDEIEKAHDDVFNIFLQILSDGRLTDNIGRVVSFAGSIIIMTTNIGQDHFLNSEIPFEAAEAAAKETLNGRYRNEFLNRFNGRQNIICFNCLDLPAMEQIVKREIKNLNAAYIQQGIATVFPDTDLKAFCKDKYDRSIGARGLPGYITTHLEPIIVNKLLDTNIEHGTLHVSYDLAKHTFVADLKEEVNGPAG